MSRAPADSFNGSNHDPENTYYQYDSEADDSSEMTTSAYSEPRVPTSAAGRGGRPGDRDAVIPLSPHQRASDGAQNVIYGYFYDPSDYDTRSAPASMQMPPVQSGRGLVEPRDHPPSSRGGPGPAPSASSSYFEPDRRQESPDEMVEREERSDEKKKRQRKGRKSSSNSDSKKSRDKPSGPGGNGKEKGPGRGRGSQAA